MGIVVVVEIVGQLSLAFGHRGQGSLTLRRQVAKGANVLDLLLDLAREHPDFAEQAFLLGGDQLSGAIAMVLNGTFLASEAELHDSLKDGDSLVLVPQMVGG